MSNIITLIGDAHSSKNNMQPFKVKYKEPRIIQSGKNKGQMKTEATIWTKSNIARKQEEDYLIQLKDAVNKRKWLEMTGNLQYPYYVAFKFYRGSKRRFDLINATQNISDCLVKAGYLEDDDADHFIPVFVPHDYDKQNPRIEFFVLDNKCSKEPITIIKQAELFL